MQLLLDALSHQLAGDCDARCENQTGLNRFARTTLDANS